mmetsp:Transcript_27512/g.65358  ORF Transcript_27512/g.65358 Transcript_27512/m.65358 type:complete len:211 (-) Transcript_27512:382-1014(-)
MEEDCLHIRPDRTLQSSFALLVHRGLPEPLSVEATAILNPATGRKLLRLLITRQKQGKHGMILKVLAHRRRVDQALDAMLSKVASLPDAAEHQDLRRHHGTSAQDHFSATFHGHHFSRSQFQHNSSDPRLSAYLLHHQLSAEGLAGHLQFGKPPEHGLDKGREGVLASTTRAICVELCGCSDIRDAGSIVIAPLRTEVFTGSEEVVNPRR